MGLVLYWLCAGLAATVTAGGAVAAYIDAKNNWIIAAIVGRRGNTNLARRESLEVYPNRSARGIVGQRLVR